MSCSRFRSSYGASSRGEGGFRRRTLFQQARTLFRQARTSFQTTRASVERPRTSCETSRTSFQPPRASFEGRSRLRQIARASLFPLRTRLNAAATFAILRRAVHEDLFPPSTLGGTSFAAVGTAVAREALRHDLRGHVRTARAMSSTRPVSMTSSARRGPRPKGPLIRGAACGLRTPGWLPQRRRSRSQQARPLEG